MDDSNLLVVNCVLSDGDLEVLFGDLLCFERTFFLGAESKSLSIELRKFHCLEWLVID